MNLREVVASKNLDGTQSELNITDQKVIPASVLVAAVEKKEMEP